MKKHFKSGNAYLVIALLVMALLFFSSSQTYEQQSQIGLLRKILAGEPFKAQLSNIHLIYAGSPVSIAAKGYFSFVEFFIRKGAHFVSYFILAGAWYLGLQPRLKNIGLAGIVGWLAATGYAALDELHQMFTGGRSPMFEDVALDSVGALTAIVLILAIVLIKRMLNKK